MNARLLAEEGALKGLNLALEGDTDGMKWTIGRDPESADLILEDESVSRLHLEITLSKEGYLVKNLSKSSPALLNDQAIEESMLLQPQDSLLIGQTLFKFALEEIVEEKDDLEKNSPDQENKEIDKKNEDRSDNQKEESDKEENSSEESSREENPSEELKEESKNSPSLFEEDLDNIDAENLLAEIDFDLAPQGRWLLKVVSGPNHGAEFSMEKGQSYTAGTSPKTCDILFHDLSVSSSHAKLTVQDDDTLLIEDLNSRNSTLVDGEKIEGQIELKANSLIALGTTAFVVIDREGESHTIVSPPLSMLGRVIHDEEAMQATQAAVQELPKEDKDNKVDIEERKEKTSDLNLQRLVLIGLLTALIVFSGIAIVSLFNPQEAVAKEQNPDAPIEAILEKYPSITYKYDQNSGKLLLIGHVQRELDQRQILYGIGNLPFIKSIDDNIIVDEYAWREANMILSRNKDYRTITISSPEAGKFVVTGYLKTDALNEKLEEFLSINFPYPERLERKIFVEERMKRLIREKLNNLSGVLVALQAGDVTLTGSVSKSQEQELDQIIQEIKALEGIRSLKNFVAKSSKESDSYIDLTDRYRVSGHTNMGKTNISVVINGRILNKGSLLDGMRVTEIGKEAIYLEKDGFKYKILYQK